MLPMRYEGVVAYLDRQHVHDKFASEEIFRHGAQHVIEGDNAHCEDDYIEIQLAKAHQVVHRVKLATELLRYSASIALVDHVHLVALDEGLREELPELTESDNADLKWSLFCPRIDIDGYGN